jgi:UDP-GlcNAc:undecaprenyl-phosphate GlcNAc-1-phosphate transferase
MDLVSANINSVFVWAFGVAFFAILSLRPLAANIGLVDRPNARKRHLGEIPLIGGIAIYFTLLILSQALIPDSQLMKLFMISCSFMVFIGALDDYYDISARVRLVAQLLIASILVVGAGFSLGSVGDLCGLGDIQLHFLAIPITLLSVVTAINAFNMTDGIDGLVGTLGLITFSSLCVLFHWSGNADLFLISAIFVAALAAFLLFNLGGLRRIFGKIFMGDAGSMMIGLSVVWLLVLGTQHQASSFRPVTALWIIAVPLIDMFAVMYRRIKKGKSPLTADRTHLHHIFMRLGLSSKQALCVISAFASVMALIGLAGEYYQVQEYIMMGLFLAVFVTYNYAFLHIWKVSKLFR